jgi:hypothetical protein
LCWGDLAIIMFGAGSPVDRPGTREAAVADIFVSYTSSDRD